MRNSSIKTIGIDLAKHHFSLVAMNKHGVVTESRSFTRTQLHRYLVNCPESLIGLEACSGAHYWARECLALGHRVKIIAPKFIAPYRTGAKNDTNDAKAICEAVNRKTIWCVPVKTPEQQAILALHRVRQGVIRERTALMNQCRGLLAEFGIVVPQGRHQLSQQLPTLIDNVDQQLPPLMITILSEVYQRIKQLNQTVVDYDRQLTASIRQSPQAQRLMSIPGVGEQIASCVAATVTDPHMFNNARQFAAWLG